ncbi:MAG: AraC family transcriptional regulator [Clostridia bacterium]|nr:AraC family transcriptional regulator [Clostridia bacterium]
MTVSELATRLDLKVYTGEQSTRERCVSGCYIGDLLSLAMSKVQMDSAWITIQTNMNIVAVSSLADGACIIIADGFVPDDSTLEKAKEQEVIILGSELSAYDIAKKLAELGI